MIVKIKKGKLDKRTVHRGLFIGGMLSVALINFAVFWVYVNFDSILMAFRLETRTGTVWGFENFRRFFREFPQAEFEWLVSLRNTLLLFVVGTLICLPLTFIFSYFMFKKVPGSKFFRVMFFLPNLISAAVLIGVFKQTFAYSGPVNEILSIISGKEVHIMFLTSDEHAMNTMLLYVLWTGFGSNIVLLTGALYRIPEDVLEYAQLDGVGFFREMGQIVLPMVWPTMSTLLIFATAGLLGNQGPALLMTDGQFKTTSFGLAIYHYVIGGQYNYPAAIGLCMTAVGFPITLFAKWVFGKIYPDVEY